MTLVLFVSSLSMACGGGGNSTSGSPNRWIGGGGDESHGGAGGTPGNASGIGGTDGASRTDAANGVTASSGATGAGGTGPSATPGSPGQPTWTILVYANADNNLGPALFADLVEMASARLGASVHLFVYADYPGGSKIPGTTETFPNGSELLRIMGNGAVETVATAPEEDFDDPKVLSAAIRSVFQAFPSDRHGLVLWDHGGAWRYGFGSDEQDGTRKGAPMPFQIVADAVRAGVVSAGIPGSPALDFFGFDACLLGSPEVASAFADLTKVFIGNAEIDYGAGWDYQNTMSWLSQHVAASAADFARQEVAIWDTHHSTEVEDRLFKSHVALDTSAFSAFSRAMAALDSSLQTNGGAVAVARAFDLALPDYQVESAGDESSPSVPLKDVGQILSSLAANANPTISSNASAAIAALNKLVLARAQGATRTSQSGLNIGAGVPVEFTPALSTLYRQLASNWNGNSHWADVIDFVRSGADALGPGITSAGLVDNTLGFQTDDADLLSVDIKLWSLSTDRKSLFFLQLLDRAYPDPGAYRFNWSGNVLALDAIPDPVLVTLSPWREISGKSGIQIPIFKTIGLLRSQGKSFYTELLIDIADGSSDTAIVYTNGLTNVFPVAALAASDTVFSPLFVRVDVETGKVDVANGPTDITISTDSIAFTTAPPGTGGYDLSLEAKDTWGNVTSQSFPFDVP